MLMIVVETLVSSGQTTYPKDVIYFTILVTLVMLSAAKFS